MNDSRKKQTLMQLQISPLKRIVITAAGMLALILLVFCFNIPNPNMILIAGLVFFSALFGFEGGTVAAIIMFVYTLYFFSTDHNFVSFTPLNTVKVFVSLFGISVDMAFVCLLKRAELQAFEEVDALTEKLRVENEHLKTISLTDALTGLRNRMALRQDFDSYMRREVTVMMLDLDRFKSINDTHGHDEGDRILRETGKLLADVFGQDHCYRFGGDEFLIIAPDLSLAQFRQKLDAVMAARPTLTLDGGQSPVGYSVGYVHALLNSSQDLRRLFSVADERMYEAKREKNQPELPEVKPLNAETDARPAEYTVREMTSYLREMSGSYDLARVVDPIECRVLELGKDGQISMKENCYGIWHADQRCVNCSSALACRTGCHHEKDEKFEDKVFHIQSNPVRLRLPDGGAYQAVVELVTIGTDTESAQQANDRAAENADGSADRYQARHDSFTRLLNEDAFYGAAREAILEKPDSLWVMITANIQDFRLVNTLFGEQRGNEVIAQTAAVLRQIAEQAGGLCGRLGGDRFGLLVPRAGFREETLTSAADALSSAFSSGLYTFRIHFGVYEMEDASIPVSVMCDRANTALRTIRDDLKKTVARFDHEMMQRSLFEQEIISGFEGALASGQFHMYLQPLVEENGRVFGAEALARWHRPDGSIVNPEAFIEALESAGLIHRLDAYMWECAVRQLALWSEAGENELVISVNMSAMDFYSMDVYSVLTGLIQKYHADSGRLRIEITETALLEDPALSGAIVSELRGQGFLVEIDDFGKGHSSLMLLKDIQADVLKIDMSLLRQIETEPRDRIILESVIRMARSLGMELIAEGVETEEQLRMLCSMGCRCFQGYYYSRPLPAEKFQEKYAAIP